MDYVMVVWRLMFDVLDGEVSSYLGGFVVSFRSTFFTCKHTACPSSLAAL